jgi:glycosyltransferase involved in cell wall biosynthesis
VAYINVSSLVGGAMKILIVAGRAESLINFRGVLIHTLLNKHHEVHVAAGDMLNNGEIQQKLLKMGCKTHHYFVKRASKNPISDLVTFFSLLKLMLYIKPDCVFSYTIKPVIYSMLAAKIAGIKKRYCLITGLGYAFQGSNQRGTLQRIAQNLYKYAIRCTHTVFFQNPDDQQLFLTKGLLGITPSVVVNGSGVDLSYYTPASLPKTNLVFLMLARLLGDKGVREYVAAAKILKKEYPHIVFQLAGEIDENPSAITQKELDSWIQEKIIDYLGNLSDVRPALAACHVFVLPSYREGTPRSVLEAMATGRAIITTNAPGCKETVENGINGFLVSVKNVVELQASIIKLIKNQSLIETMGIASLQLVKEKYEVHKINAQLTNQMGL